LENNVANGNFPISQTLRESGSMLRLSKCTNLANSLTNFFANLINNPAFENGIIKLQSGREAELTRLEATPGNQEEEEDEETDVGYAERVLLNANRAKKQRNDVSKYRSTRHVISQSNLCERLFSLAKLIMSDRRKSMHPKTLNNVLLLRANRHLWNGRLIYTDSRHFECPRFGPGSCRCCL